MLARIEGDFLAAEIRDYDFPDENEPGRQVTGQTYSVSVLQETEVTKVKVKDVKDRELFAHLQRHDPVDMLVDIRANRGARGAYLSITFAEMISSPSQLKAAKPA